MGHVTAQSDRHFRVACCSKPDHERTCRSDHMRFGDKQVVLHHRQLLSPDGVDMDAFSTFLADRDIITGSAHGKLRWVTHLDIDDEAIERVRRACKEFFGR